MAEYIWNNMAFNSKDEMLLAREIPAVYLDRWNDAGYVAEAILGSDWMREHDREIALNAYDSGYRDGYNQLPFYESMESE